ncbi:hypothetical protein MJO29_004409 [Puccinia striiformis f. sp. tritici]|uniref:Uncharacterized protein n=1 Tax=Puccinia striiformis f. sp. tritici PST-78 TaxID=1165861 RepID=A0A0L0VNH4_9BASI|nr:hypothetical protein Pst134EA_007461 [Puccinia striiformis f. sp. tritici]KAH9460407.1 hypothetical protein Pst134EB_008580 [Puccinia striiformis f. sp. tritici]KAH9470197.1 hypothetical protein Pst134EA_007461 [Puccinia striiformis f. sp. tritici]KAI7963982.1 hypothetical protein MJO29_004409 [Puccinia striiformis f. sp. tritici]KNF00838.1 hypothetical protein PSTG_05972 [Puccinia striiformis f. sp. tritici PST-78]
MSQLADHSRDRELLYATLGGLQPVGTCLAWVVGLTICEALRLTQRFDPKTSLIKRIFVYFSLVMSVAVLSLFLALIYLLAVVNYGQYRKLLDITGIFRFDYMVTRIATLGGLTYYSYDVWHSEMGKIKMWRIPIIKVSIGVFYLGVTGIFIFRIALVFLLVKIPDSSLSVEKWPTYRTGQYVQLIEGAVLTFLKAYDLVKSGAVKKVLATRDDPHGFSWSLLCCLCQTAILPTVFDLIAVSLPAPKGVNGTAYALSSISAELHLFGPIVAISAALDDMNVSSGELHCSLENTLTRETSQSILASDQGRKVSFKTPEMGRRKYMT